MPSVTLDGPYEQAGGYEVGAPVFEYPFEANGDMETVVITRSYKQTRPAFQTDRLAAAFVPGVYEDPAYPGAYLMATSKPAETRTGLYSFNRVFATVPQSQVTPGSLFVTKPIIPGTFPQIIGDSLVLQPDPTTPIYTFNTRKSVTSDSGAPAASNYPTGGTWTITVGGQTTSPIAYNASAATIKSALDALSNVSNRGGSFVARAYNDPLGIGLSFDAYSAGSLDPSSLTVSSGVAAAGIPALTSLGHRQFFQAFSADLLPGTLFTGGTFTLTFFGQTTSPIAYNANKSAVQSALAALSKVGSDVVVTVSAGTDPLIIGGFSGSKIIQFTVEIPGYPVSVDGSGLTPTGSSASFSPIGGSLLLGGDITFHGVTPTTRTITIDGGHEISGSDSIYVLQGGAYATLAPGAFTVIDANTIQLNASAGGVFSNAGVITAVGKQNGQTYTAGTKLTRCNRVTDFYLPGVTPGIGSADDIPLPPYQGDAGTLLDAIFSGETAINYEVGELTKWRDWPILQRTITTLNASTL